jgi:hypothetical protein
MLPSLLPFERLHVTILVVACYLAIIVSTVIVQETLPEPPERHGSPGLNVDDAWSDLQEVSPFHYQDPVRMISSFLVSSFLARPSSSPIQFSHQ